jgi:hypothetical protein
MMFMTDQIIASEAQFPLLPLMAGIAIMTGLFMLIFGRKVLRIGLGVIGATAGGLCGNLFCTYLTTPPPAMTAILIGAIIGLGLGLLFWKLTITSLMAASCGVLAGGLCSIVLLNGWVQIVAPHEFDKDSQRLPANVAVTFNDDPDASNTPPTLEDRITQATKEHSIALAEDAWSQVNTGLGQLGNEMTRTTQAALRQSGDLWNQLTTVQKQYVMISSVLGAVFGILLSVGARRCSGALVTAMAGSGLVLLGGLTLTEILYPTGGAVLKRIDPGLWVLGWVALALLGGLFSWQLERQKADKQTETC